jgi:hypothetical protein
MVGNTTIAKEDVTESGTRFGPLRNTTECRVQEIEDLCAVDRRLAGA